jgi:hypothetical protein
MFELIITLTNQMLYMTAFLVCSQFQQAALSVVPWLSRAQSDINVNLSKTKAVLIYLAKPTYLSSRESSFMLLVVLSCKIHVWVKHNTDKSNAVHDRFSRLFSISASSTQCCTLAFSYPVRYKCTSVNHLKANVVHKQLNLTSKTT